MAAHSTQIRSKRAVARRTATAATPDLPAPRRVRPSDPAAALVVESVRDGLRRLLQQEPEAQLGRAESIHRVRVACRRLRSNLAMLQPLLVAGSCDGLRTDLAWLADELASARDVHVLRTRLARAFAIDGLQQLDPAVFARVDAQLAHDEAAAVSRALAAFDDPRYMRLLTRAASYAEEPALTVVARRSVREVLPGLVAAAVADFDIAVDHLSRMAPDERWHRARLRAKRARYAAETAAGVWGSSASRLVAAMKAVQKVLGEHQDAVVAAEAILRVAAAHPEDLDIARLCGRLAERERTAVRDARSRFTKTWARATTRPARRWLS